MTYEQLKQLPKIELHCHLDGSLSQIYLEERLQRAVAKSEMSVSDDCQSLAEYLEKFDLPCQCLMDEEGLIQAGIDILENMSQEHVIYAEIRFAPMLLLSESMNEEQIIEAVLKGLAEGSKRYGVKAQLIICLMRHQSFEENLRALKAAEKFLGKGVCALDLAGGEAEHPMAEFMELFGIAKEKKIPFTLHAGECGSVENIADSVAAGAGRVGHGIAARGNAQMKAILKEKKIGIEMCPISNLQTKSVKGPEEYPLKEFLEEGLRVTINTDNRSVSDTSLTKELAMIQETYGVTDEEICQMMKNAVEVAFLGEEEKEELRRRIGE